MAMVNIPTSVTDAQYRYKMPRLISKHEGRGNGSKTCVMNMGDVARALKRAPQYTLKWFGFELGAQTTYTVNPGEGERAIVNGHHNTDVFQTMLDKFIDKYVLCQNCHLPEIDMNVKKDGIKAKCKACGWAGELDSFHKLSIFIMNNPPDAQGNMIEKGKGGEAEGKRARQLARAAKQKADAEGEKDGDEDADGDSEEGKKEKKEKKEKKDKKDKKEKKKKEKDGDDDSEGEGKKEKKEKKEKKDKKEKKEKKSKDSKDAEGSDDEKTEKKDKKDKKEKKDKKDKKATKEESEGSEDETPDVVSLKYDDSDTKEVITTIRDFIESHDGKPSVADLFEEVRLQQIAKVFDNEVRLYIVFEALFPESMTGKQITSKMKVLERFVSNGNMTTAQILWACGAYLSENFDSAKKSFPMALKALYDGDLLEEKPLLDYYNEDEGSNDPGFEKAKKIANPFLEWVAKPEDSDSSDSDSD